MPIHCKGNRRAATNRSVTPIARAPRGLPSSPSRRSFGLWIPCYVSLSPLPPIMIEFDPSEERLTIQVEQKECCAEEENEGEEAAVVSSANLPSLHREEPGTGDTAYGAEQEEGAKRQRTGTKDVTQKVFRKAGDEKEEEGDPLSCSSREEEEHLVGLGCNEPTSEMVSQPTTHAEGEARADGEADHGIDEAWKRSEEIAANDARRLTRDRCNDDLEGLEPDEHERRPRSRLFDVPS